MDGKNHHFDGVIHIPLPGHAIDNWEINIMFTHTVVDLEYGKTIFDAIPVPIDEFQNEWKFYPVNGESLTGSSFDLLLTGRCWEPDIGYRWVKICSPNDLGGDGQDWTTQSPITNPSEGQTITPPHDLGLCSGPDGIRVDWSDQAIIDFKSSTPQELGVTRFDLNEVVHKSILFYEVKTK